MASSLTCPCGARFEVEEALAGKTVPCPECGQPLEAPAAQHFPVRTSGLALASAVLALVGAFTVIGTVAAVFLGVLALVSIARQRDRLAGLGLATFGILAGATFTTLTLLAFSTSELFGLGGWMRERNLAGQVDTSGPLEVDVPGKGIRLTRPSARWGRAHGDQIDDPVAAVFQHDRDLVLVQVARYAFVDVRVDRSALFHPLDACQSIPLDEFRPTAAPANPFAGDDNPGLHISGQPVVRESRRLPARDGLDGLEMLVDVRCAGQTWRFLIHLYKRKNGPLYVVRGYTQRRRFAQVEAELRKALDSFHARGG